MIVKFAYHGRSALRGDRAGQTVNLAPNLARDPVAFDAPLLKPLRFREAICALHDVVISDLRYRKKDKTAYREWKRRQSERASAIRQAEYERMAEAARVKHEIPADLESNHHRCRKRYWEARQQYASYLLKHDRELWRMLMPCDPVITVAEDVVFFECFSADESSYGCLTVNRDGFGNRDGAKLGTTNVDYSWDLFNHFQSLRSYRQTRLRIDPAGFELATRGGEDYREEKIDLPSGWLRGFMELQSAMGLPTVRVNLGREAVYSILAWLKRHRSERSPRGVRFELEQDRPPRIVLDPWEQTITSHGTKYDGPPTEPIRIWGRRRLAALARLLPLADGFDVYLAGTGLPSFWVARMGEMTLTLGLSGWTANDWTRASAIDLVAPTVTSSPEQVRVVGEHLRRVRSAPLAMVARNTMIDPALAAAALRRLAHSGQVIYDLPGGVYRWRQIMPQIVGEAEIGPEHPELAEARRIMANRPVQVEMREPGPSATLALAGKIDGCPVEILLDAENNVKRGKCVCPYYRRYLLRNGPCRHMQVLRRLHAQQTQAVPWAQRLGRSGVVR